MDSGGLTFTLLHSSSLFLPSSAAKSSHSGHSLKICSSSVLSAFNLKTPARGLALLHFRPSWMRKSGGLLVPGGRGLYEFTTMSHASFPRTTPRRYIMGETRRALPRGHQAALDGICARDV